MAAEPGPAPGHPGLLDQITASSLDADYAAAARRRLRRARRTSLPAGAGSPDRTTAAARVQPQRGGWAVVALVLFGLLVGTAAVRTAEAAGQRESSRASLVAEINDAQADLDRARARLDTVRGQVRRTTTANATAEAARRAAELRLTRLQAAVGTAAVRGPGVRIVVDDDPLASSDEHTVLDMDLQNITNGLWEAGAEAVAINGHRISALTAIRQAGGSITVNYQPIARPYVVLAVGDPDRLPARFVESTTGALWLNAREQFNLRFDMTSEDSLTVPAAPRVSLRHAEGLPGAARNSS